MKVDAGRFWGPTLLWGLGLVFVYTVGAFVGEPATGTCMFVLMPYFAAIAATVPIVRSGRFGAGLVAFIPYAVLGFVPLYVFDWAQSHALRGIWAVFAWSATGPVIGVCADAAYRLTASRSEPVRATVTGAVMQAATFVLMLLGLTLLYMDPSAGDSHARLFDSEWYFTAPWMIANGAFGGYTAHTMFGHARPDLLHG